MIIKKILAGIALLLIIVVAGISIYNRKYQFSVKVIKNEQGWGYDILQGKRLIIHQPYMPGISGQVAFENKNSARKTGQLVVKKIKNKKPPAVNIDELNSIIKRTD
jgi:hypothetical protein